MSDKTVTVTLARDISEYGEIELPESLVTDSEMRQLIAEYVDNPDSSDDSRFDALPSEVKEALDNLILGPDDLSTTSNYRMLNATRNDDDCELFDIEEIHMVVDDFVNNTSTVKAMSDSIEIPEFGISICGNQLQVTESMRPKGDILLVAAVHAVHSLVLAQHMAGIDVTNKEYIESLRTTFDALGNNLEEFNGNEDKAVCVILTS